MSSLRESLSKTMAKAGAVSHKFTKLTHSRKTIKGKRTGITNEEGEDFGKIEWDQRELQNLLAGAENKEIISLIPQLNAKRILHLTSSSTNFIKLLEKKGGQDVYELDVTRHEEEPHPHHHHPLAKGALDKLPFQSESFDFILFPSALAWRSDFPNLIPELARCLKENGRAVISVVHPFFEYLINPKGGFRHNISEIFTLFNHYGFFIDELHESTVDESMRYVSLSNNLTQRLKSFHSLPVVLLMRGIFVKKRKKE